MDVSGRAYHANLTQLLHGPYIASPKKNKTDKVVKRERKRKRKRKKNRKRE